MLRNHGIYKDKGVQSQKPWFYEMRELGFNYRLTDFQCALGISQLGRIGQFIQKRRHLTQYYKQLLRGINGLSVIDEPQGLESSCHLFLVRIQFAKFKTTRPIAMKELKRRGINAQVHYIPIYQQPYYRKNLGYQYRRSRCRRQPNFLDRNWCRIYLFIL